MALWSYGARVSLDKVAVADGFQGIPSGWRSFCTWTRDPSFRGEANAISSKNSMATALSYCRPVQGRAAALRQARSILRHHGKSYYFSTCLFPRELQDSTCALYAFVRLPDEIVDSSRGNTAEAREKLLEYVEAWNKAYRTGFSKHPILQLASETFHQHAIPYEYSESFLRTMIQDTEKAEYEDYAELERYMYGSAACIGLMMSYIIGYTEAKALEHAQKLGYAMQMTNFLRDIDEDFQEHGRVYMPKEELAQFGLSRSDIENRRFGASFQQFMQWQAQRCECLYEEANVGIAMLQPKGRFAVATASTLYRAILGKMEQRGWNPFDGRAATSLPEKLWLVGKARQLSRRAH